MKSPREKGPATDPIARRDGGVFRLVVAPVAAAVAGSVAAIVVVVAVIVAVGGWLMTHYGDLSATIMSIGLVLVVGISLFRPKSR